MLEVQFALGGGVLHPVVEHGGDILHRMNEWGPRNEYGYDNIKGKVTRVVDALDDKYGFEREHGENVASNGEDNKNGRAAYEAKLNSTLDRYADEHAALPVFNDLQRLAQSAAVAVGRQDWDTARAKFHQLKDELDKGKDHWVREAGKTDVAKSNENCPVCGEKYSSQCRCPGPHTMESLRKGHGKECPRGHRWSGDLVLDETDPT